MTEESKINMKSNDHRMKDLFKQNESKSRQSILINTRDATLLELKDLSKDCSSPRPPSNKKLP